MKNNYIAPSVYIIEVAIERGIAESPGFEKGNNNPGDYTEGGSAL